MKDEKIINKKITQVEKMKFKGEKVGDYVIAKTGHRFSVFISSKRDRDEFNKLKQKDERHNH